MELKDGMLYIAGGGGVCLSISQPLSLLSLTSQSSILTLKREGEGVGRSRQKSLNPGDLLLSLSADTVKAQSKPPDVIAVYTMDGESDMWRRKK